MTAIIDKVLLRQSLKELTILEPEFVSALIQELEQDIKKTKRQRLEQIINEDFKEYEDVFKALA